MTDETIDQIIESIKEIFNGTMPDEMEGAADEFYQYLNSLKKENNEEADKVIEILDSEQAEDDTATAQRQWQIDEIEAATT